MQFPHSELNSPFYLLASGPGWLLAHNAFHANASCNKGSNSPSTCRSPDGDASRSLSDILPRKDLTLAVRAERRSAPTTPAAQRPRSGGDKLLLQARQEIKVKSILY